MRKVLLDFHTISSPISLASAILSHKGLADIVVWDEDYKGLVNSLADFLIIVDEAKEVYTPKAVTWVDAQSIRRLRGLYSSHYPEKGDDFLSFIGGYADFLRHLTGLASTSMLFVRSKDGDASFVGFDETKVPESWRDSPPNQMKKDVTVSQRGDRPKPEEVDSILRELPWPKGYFKFERSPTPVQFLDSYFLLRHCLDSGVVTTIGSDEVSYLRGHRYLSPTDRRILLEGAERLLSEDLMRYSWIIRDLCRDELIGMSLARAIPIHSADKLLERWVNQHLVLEPWTPRPLLKELSKTIRFRPDAFSLKELADALCGTVDTPLLEKFLRTGADLQRRHQLIENLFEFSGDLLVAIIEPIAPIVSSASYAALKLILKIRSWRERK